MKAAVVESYGALVVREVSDPVPGDYEVLCELLYGATCTGTDTHLIHGHEPVCNWVKLPFILGHESIGRVVELGPKVRHFRVGDVVTRVGAPAGNGVNIGWGGYAQFGIARDHWAMCADGLPPPQWAGNRVNQVVPTGVDPRVAPMFTTWRETLSCMLRLGVDAGANVLVVGSGGNGLSFAAHAGILGAGVTAMVGSAALEPVAREGVGVQAYVDYKSPTVTASLKEQVPTGFDFVIDAVGRAGVADQVVPCIKPGGSYVTYGIDERDAVRINPLLAPGPVMVRPCPYDESETHQRVSEWVMQGKLNAAPWYDVDAAFRLTDINDAFEHVWGRKSPKALVALTE